jgi:hypothetical protein
MAAKPMVLALWRPILFLPFAAVFSLFCTSAM